LPGLALNCDPANLHLISWDCRCEPLNPAHKIIFLDLYPLIPEGKRDLKPEGESTGEALREDSVIKTCVEFVVHLTI
jgi:hypothetical protein